MNKQASFLQVALAGALSMSSCEQSSDEPGAGTPEATPPQVVAVNEPLAYFVRRIGGELVSAHCPAPADGDPAFWVPEDDALTAIQQADLILLNGAGYARWVDAASLPESRMVDTSAEFRNRLISIEGRVTHSHGPEGAHDHGAMAFTTWLDLDLARQHADAVHLALTKIPGIDAGLLESGHTELSRDLRELDTHFKAWGGSLKGASLLGSHPVYQYLAHAYGLNLRSVHWEPHAAPGEEEWKTLATLLADHPAKWMLWEGEPLPETAERLDTLGVKCDVLDPGGAPSEEGDFLSLMTANLERLQAPSPRP